MGLQRCRWQNKVGKKDAVGWAFFPDEVKSGKGDAVGIEFYVKLVKGICPSHGIDFPVFSQVDVQVFQKKLSEGQGRAIRSILSTDSPATSMRWPARVTRALGTSLLPFMSAFESEDSFKTLIFQRTDIWTQVFQGQGA